MTVRHRRVGLPLLAARRSGGTDAAGAAGDRGGSALRDEGSDADIGLWTRTDDAHAGLRRFLTVERARELLT